MSFFNQKSKSMSSGDFFEALTNGSLGQHESSIRKHSAEYDRRNQNNGFDPVWDDNLPDDYVVNGWGGLDDDE